MTAPLDPDMFDPVCPSDLSPFRVGGNKWAAMVLRCLEDGPRRFSELRVPLRGITAKVLTQTLRGMERDGLIARTAHTAPDRRVLYELTDLGHSLLVPLSTMCDWTVAHLDELMAARDAAVATSRAGSSS